MKDYVWRRFALKIERVESLPFNININHIRQNKHT